MGRTNGAGCAPRAGSLLPPARGEEADRRTEPARLAYILEVLEAVERASEYEGDGVRKRWRKLGAGSGELLRRFLKCSMLLGPAIARAHPVTVVHCYRLLALDASNRVKDLSEAGSASPFEALPDLHEVVLHDILVHELVLIGEYLASRLLVITEKDDYSLLLAPILDDYVVVQAVIRAPVFTLHKLPSRPRLEVFDFVDNDASVAPPDRDRCLLDSVSH
ncbi:hypothetical protein C8R44DRAFT_875753 [Mycena epipterygia]|nr:hypothetical protein C8R44DRAFT_875753 [Mycena epipterygia]